MLFRLSSVDLMKLGAKVPGMPFGAEPLRLCRGGIVERVGGKEDKDCRWILFGGVGANGTDGAGNDEGDSDGRGGEEDNDGMDKSLEGTGVATAAGEGGDT